MWGFLPVSCPWTGSGNHGGQLRDKGGNGHLQDFLDLELPGRHQEEDPQSPGYITGEMKECGEGLKGEHSTRAAPAPIPEKALSAVL